MKRWLLLLLFVICWTTAGLALLDVKGSDNAPTSQNSTPARIVSLAPNLTEILFALGLEENIKAVTSDSDYPPAAQTIPFVGNFWQIDIESIVAAKPDLVITLGFQQQTQTAWRLRRLGYNCLTVNIDTVSEFFDALRQIGEATNSQLSAKKITDRINQKIESFSEFTKDSQRPNVLWVIQRQPLRVAGTDTFINELITLAGGQNAIGPTIHKYPPIGAEQVIASQADIIIEPAMFENSSQQQTQSPYDFYKKFKNLPAVKNGRIYIVSGDLTCRLSPRLDKTLELIASCIRPTLSEN